MRRTLPVTTLWQRQTPDHRRLKTVRGHRFYDGVYTWRNYSYVPSWGVILAEGRLYIQQAPWLVIYPGVAIMLTIFGLNMFGDGLRDLLDPKIRGLTSERQSQT